jgi:head-tail adaptor
MQAGDLNKRIIIQQATKARDAAGGFTVTWVTFVTVWAEAF